MQYAEWSFYKYQIRHTKEDFDGLKIYCTAAYLTVIPNRLESPQSRPQAAKQNVLFVVTVYILRGTDILKNVSYRHTEFLHAKKICCWFQVAEAHLLTKHHHCSPIVQVNIHSKCHLHLTFEVVF
jgi:hypothetical protein